MMHHQLFFGLYVLFISVNWYPVIFMLADWILAMSDENINALLISLKITDICHQILKDYVATRWYRAPELCGSFFSKVSDMLYKHRCNCYGANDPVIGFLSLVIFQSCPNYVLLPSFLLPFFSPVYVK